LIVYGTATPFCNSSSLPAGKVPTTATCSLNNISTSVPVKLVVAEVMVGLVLSVELVTVNQFEGPLE